MLKKTGIFLAACIIIFVIGGFLLPSTTVITRSITINAPDALVFELVSNHKDFKRWSPWAKRDPHMQVRLEGPAKGLGSKSYWRSEHPQVGSGESTYTVYEPYKTATLSLTFEQGGGDAVFTLNKIDAAQTALQWQFITQNTNVIERYFGYFLLENMLAPDYEQGLADLKILAESLPAIKNEEVTYRDGDTELTGYWSRPLGKPDAPVVIVVHEWWGHNAYVRERAAMLAKLGYNALAIDMYGDGKLARHPSDAKAFMMAVVNNQAALYGRFESALALVRAQPEHKNSPIAAVGYCFGGAVVLSMARANKDIAGVVSFHGSLGGLAPIATGADVPALVLNGAADPFVTEEQIATFKQEMSAANIPFDFINYEGAKHSFTSKRADQAGKEFDMPLAYDKKADEASWLAMAGFLGEIFGE